MKFLSLFLWLTATATLPTSLLVSRSASIGAAAASPVVISPGMTNLGNTCYLNSQLECAFHIPLIRSLIESPPLTFVTKDTHNQQQDEEAIPITEPTEEASEASGEYDTEDTQPSLESTEEDPAESGVSVEATEESSVTDDAATGSASAAIEEETPSEVAPVDEIAEGQAEDDSGAQSTTEEEVSAEEEEESLAIQALRKVFQDMAASSTPIAPRILCQVLGIPVFEQQDSQEFWKLLLPALQCPDLIDLYQGSFEAYIKANDGSNRERTREEPFLDLSLDISEDSILDSLHEDFGEPELLSVKEGNGWRPEKGAEKVDALKGSLLRVQGLPSILQMHLKRFNYDWQTDQMDKVNKKCTFPESLDLTSLCADIQDEEKPAAIYSLQSVVVHAGEYGSGHYYSYVRPDIQSDDWYRFNDHVVTKVSFDEVIADAYGGRRSKAPSSIQKKRNGPRQMLCRLRKALMPSKAPFGFGGRTSNALSNELLLMPACL
ncbi:Probable ubiquitin carboxyl-terminal hydrolase FAF [Seminavis robusta]|uniref:Probable ubiquitin carboxyl-terminal hydrolase FAF n=1 Tax=Seminavis robusta TaxID=568900 RepID=A0A9N8EAI9_9STRA|nr:Probable ubiquitin carboxyl-terminal hydrolase FAF [Seminavis robusta]|eukprot:Sro810_g205770.1 Probable ubiquitin carboxyl-terminal hydrolase FAF (491) ;mRNA; f:25680-27331